MVNFCIEKCIQALALSRGFLFFGQVGTVKMHWHRDARFGKRPLHGSENQDAPARV